MSFSEALPTTAIDTASEFTRRSATSNCKWMTCPSSLRGGLSGIRTQQPTVERHRLYQCATTPHILSGTTLYLSLAPKLREQPVLFELNFTRMYTVCFLLRNFRYSTPLFATEDRRNKTETVLNKVPVAHSLATICIAWEFYRHHDLCTGSRIT